MDWQDEEEALYQRYRKEKDRHLGQRWQALWLLRRGTHLEEVASLVGVHYRTVQEWVTWYRKGGVEEVARHQVGGARRTRQPLLTRGQEEALLQKARADGFATVRSAVGWAGEELGVSLTVRQMRRVFQKMGLKRKVPRPVATKASAQAQEAWKKGGLRPVWRRQG